MKSTGIECMSALEWEFAMQLQPLGQPIQKVVVPPLSIAKSGDRLVMLGQCAKRYVDKHCLWGAGSGAGILYIRVERLVVRMVERNNKHVCKACGRRAKVHP